MSSSICKSFESNAWRSDLCSHCFQSKEEHGNTTTSSDPNKTDATHGLGSRYQSVLNHSRSSYRTTTSVGSSSTTTSAPPAMSTTGVKAILKTTNTNHGKHSKSVNFPDDEQDAQVIGYGGHECFDWDDDNDANDDANDDDDDDQLPFTEEERMIHSQTQKNTSFNSVSRNLLAADVATFKNHGTSSSTAPLVTIRPFGQSSTPTHQAPRMKLTTTSSSDCPKINLVSPMRNGQVLTSSSPAMSGVTNQQPNNKEEIKNRENLFKLKTAMTKEQLNDDVKKPSVNEPITSFSNPVPTEIQPESITAKEIKENDHLPSLVTPSPTMTSTNNSSNKIISNPKAMVLQSSKVASGRIDATANDSSPKSTNRITLSRKPPVWREKPRIPIKPQSVTQQTSLVVEAIPSALYPKAKPSDQQQQQSNNNNNNMKLIKSDSAPGQISVRFVHLSSSGDDSGQSSAHSLPPLLPAQTTKELSALERLDLLESAGTKMAPLDDVHSTLLESSLKAPEVAEILELAASPPPLEINNNPIKFDQAEPEKINGHRHETEVKKPEEASAKDEADGDGSRSSSQQSTRGLTRSAFEALRANLAGTLELSRVYQPQRTTTTAANVNNTKRQAPPTPLSRAETEDSTEVDSLPPLSIPPTPPPLPASLAGGPQTPVSTTVRPDGKDGEEDEDKAAVPVNADNNPSGGPAKPTMESRHAGGKSVVKSTGSERSVSVSPRYRNSFICTSPEGSLSLVKDELDVAPARSVSLTRVERSDSQCMSTKPPSIRKILRERANQFLQLAESSGGNCRSPPSGESGRLSRSERFAAEAGTVSAKKTKNRFSLRKFLGLKKESGWDDTAEPLPPKIRPEIVHPIDFHPVGQVQVVAGKVDSSRMTSDVIGLSPTHDSMSSTDSGRHSSLDLHRSDSSVGGGSDCPSPANSHQSSSYKHNGSIKGRPKPPPPPRFNSLDQQASGGGSSGASRCNASTPTNRPTRPPPPKSGEPQDADRFSPSPVQNTNPTEYANLGDIRNGITPKKPERSASMKARERSVAVESRPSPATGRSSSNKQDGLHYDCVSIQQPSSLNKPTADEDGYIIPMRMKSSPSFSSVSTSSASSSHRFSLSSFQPSSTSDSPPKRPSRLGARQSRQDLHVKLEDHYGTVTGANFQALVQLLEQATSKRPLAPHFHELRRIKSQHLKWDVFGDHRLLLRTSSVTVVQSSWQNHDLLLSVYNDAYVHEMTLDNKTPFAQPAIVDFTGTVPAPLQPASGIKAGIEVFPPGQVAMLKQLPHLLAMELDGEVERLQHSLSVFLQVCRSLEWLVQQRRTGHRLNDEEIVFYREHSQDAYRLLWLPQEPQSAALSVKETLCNSLRLLAPLLSTQLADKLSSIVQRDSASLDKLCQFLEFTMFGPTVDPADNDPDPMDTFQRWLDVERASALNELIRTQGLWRVKLSIVEEFRLSFLISTSPHHLLDISQM